MNDPHLISDSMWAGVPPAQHPQHGWSTGPSLSHDLQGLAGLTATPWRAKRANGQAGTPDHADLEPEKLRISWNIPGMIIVVAFQHGCDGVEQHAHIFPPSAVSVLQTG